MKRILCLCVFIMILGPTLVTTPLFAEQEVDNCAQKGIVVKNLTMLDLWYKRNGGDCIIWIHDHVVFIKPGDVIEIFSDLTCKTPYCSSNPSYKDYKALDKNGDCAVRILPDCNVTDM